MTVSRYEWVAPNSEIDELVATLDTIVSLEGPSELDRLDDAVRCLGNLPHSDRAVDALFNVFERFPNTDDFGVFWSVLHAIEKQGGYEARLVQSVRRLPVEFNLVMVNRLLNSGTKVVDNTDLLGQVVENLNYSNSARKWAQEFSEFQRSRMT